LSLETRAAPPIRPADFRGFHLDVAARELVREYNRRLRPHGLSYVPYFVLLLLAASDGGRRPSDLAAELHADGSSLSGHLDNLEGAGLAERRPDPADKRVIRVYPTAAAQRLLDDLAPLGRALSALEPDLAPDAIARIERAVRTPPPPPPRAAPQRTRAGLVTTLRVATLTAPQSTVGRVLTRFAALLEERSGGAIRVALDLPSLAPGGELQTLGDLRAGDLALASITVPAAGAVIPAAQLIELPYLLEDFEHANAFVDGPFGAGVLDAAAEHGLTGLGFVVNGFRSLTTRDDVAVSGPEALHGVRLRVQESPINVHYAEAFGAIAVPLAFPLLAEALAAGEIDAQENALANVAGLELWTTQRRLTLTRHAVSAHVVLANADLLAALGSGATLVAEAMRDALAEGRRGAAALEAELTTLLAARMTVAPIDAATRARFVAATHLVRDRLSRALGDEPVVRALAAAAAAAHPSSTA
jgi:TRAP-type C4-dicarboxylate transport system substrate-binding protein/DNA-binding MarR family transcriptional regulator